MVRILFGAIRGTSIREDVLNPCDPAAVGARCDLIAAGFQRDVFVCMANAGNFRFLSASSKVTR
jgi:hypothetical protein